MPGVDKQDVIGVVYELVKLAVGGDISLSATRNRQGDEFGGRATA